MSDCDFAIIERLDVVDVVDVYKRLYARGRHGQPPKSVQWMFDRGRDWVRAVMPLDHLDFQTAEDSGPDRIERAKRYADRGEGFPPGVATYGGLARHRRTGKAYVHDGNHRALAASMRGDCAVEMFIPERDYAALVDDARGRQIPAAIREAVRVSMFKKRPRYETLVRAAAGNPFMPTSPFILAGNKALDAISNLDDVPPGFLQGDAVRDAAYRALEAGAEPPLEYIGAGATGIVFCDPHYAFKVARHRKGRTLDDEAEWLETAARIPEVAPHVAAIERWDPKQRVIVRECVRGSRGAWGASAKIHALWDRIAPYMLAEGWTMPELKEDSVIFDDDGNPKIVDAGMVSRISNRLLGYVEAVLDGRITPDEYEDWSTLAFYVRREFGQKEDFDERRANLILDRLYTLGARRD